MRIGVVIPPSTPVPDTLEECIASFEGKVEMTVYPSAPTESDCDVVFAPAGGNAVNVGIPRDPACCRTLKWSVVSLLGAPDRPALPMLIHALVAPSVIWGWVGIDWSDLRIVLECGGDAYLAVVEGERMESLSRAHELVAKEIDRSTHPCRVTGIATILIAPFDSFVPYARSAVVWGRSFAQPDDSEFVNVLGGPVSIDGTSIVALLVKAA